MGPSAERKRATFILRIALLPSAVLLQETAFRVPGMIDRVYGGWMYPAVVAVLGGMNRLVPFSLAEALCGVTLCGILVALAARWTGRRGKVRGWWKKALRAAAGVWTLAGVVAWTFLLLWGLNYARPSIRERLGLKVEGIEAEEVLDAGRRCAARAEALYSILGAERGQPTRLPVDFADLNEIVDRRLSELALPDDRIRHSTSPVKKLFVSEALCYLGVSGVFVPFTGEPSMNRMIPAVFTPVVVAHEKAHQRGITHEGEANFVGFLACAGAEGYPYVQYSAYLYATAQLIGSASLRLPNESATAWRILGEGPMTDLEAVRTFWARYEGKIADLAEEVNDAYLRAQRVPGGVESYNQVTRLLVAIDRQGRLVPSTGGRR